MECPESRSDWRGYHGTAMERHEWKRSVISGVEIDPLNQVVKLIENLSPFNRRIVPLSDSRIVPGRQIDFMSAARQSLFMTFRTIHPIKVSTKFTAREDAGDTARVGKRRGW